MPFEDAEIMRGSGYENMASVRYMRIRNKNKKDDDHPGSRRPRLLIGLPTTVFLSNAKAAKLLVGSGTDTGKLRVVCVSKPDKSATKIAGFRGHVMIRFGHVKQFGDDVFDTVHCQLERIDNDTYEITLGFDPRAPEIISTVPPRKPGK